ncbi:hypothetical protein ACLMJK_005159 [Lecanora helva]
MSTSSSVPRPSQDTSIMDGSKSAPSTAANLSTPWSVESVLSTLPESYPRTPPKSPLPFLHLMERLKTTKREGWRRFHIEHGESISDHMYRMSIITMLAPPSLSAKLNIPHCTKMALAHDMAESLVGDITPRDDVAKQVGEKARREGLTMDYLCNTLLGAWHGGEPGKDIRAIFQEYEDEITQESLFVHDVDKIELLLQMLEYERRGRGDVDLSEFLGVRAKVKLDEMKEWAEQILVERDEFWKGIGKVPSDWR